MYETSIVLLVISYRGLKRKVQIDPAGPNLVRDEVGAAEDDCERRVHAANGADNGPKNDWNEIELGLL